MQDADHFFVWCYLLLMATHQEKPVLFQGKKIVLKPGQLITGRRSISAFTGVSESKIQRMLYTFKTEQQIEQQSSSNNRLITILNWDEYQSPEQQNEQQMNNERTTSEQRVNTNKNVKNERMKEGIVTPLTPLEKAVEDFKKHRKETKAPMTERATELMLSRLEKMAPGNDDRKIWLINYAIERGWKGIYEPKEIATPPRNERNLKPEPVKNPAQEQKEMDDIKKLWTG